MGFTLTAIAFGATQSARGRWAAVAKPKNWELSENVVGACIEVHRQLGPGLLESVYEAALCEELTLRSVPFVQQSTFPVTYKGRTLDQLYRIDLVVSDSLIVEVKSVEKLLPVHEAQALTYLRLTSFDSALLVNFNTALLHHGLRRLSLTPQKNSPSSPSPRLPVELEGLATTDQRANGPRR